MAGAAKGLHAASEDELAVETAAHIASELILAGRGDEVLKLYAVATARDGEAGGGEDGPKSPLTRALERLPGMPGVPGQSQPTDDTAHGPAFTQGYPQSATDAKSVAPLFIAQMPLIDPRAEGAVHAVEDADQAPREASNTRAPGSWPTGGRAPATPYPPSGASPEFIQVHAENLEKNGAPA